VSVSNSTVLNPNGRVRLQGGTLATSAVVFEGAGEFEWTSGTLHVGTFNGNLVNPSGGTLAPGLGNASTDQTIINGNYVQQSSAKLELEIRGTTQASQYDQLLINGAASLGGELVLGLLDGFMPSPQQTFIILFASTLQGSFANAANGQRLATEDGLGSFLVTYAANGLFLNNFQAAPLPGDFNSNGVVDASDYVMWRKGLGTSYTQTHYNLWRAHFGQTLGSGATGSTRLSSPKSASTNALGANVALPIRASVPEPAALALSALAISAWFLRRHSRTGCQS
jgi:hypothetical protein